MFIDVLEFLDLLMVQRDHELKNFLMILVHSNKFIAVIVIESLYRQSQCDDVYT